ncbi:MAG: hypothetical protein ACAI44_25460 [Candidatus Sericytochromatia bacterium]
MLALPSAAPTPGPGSSPTASPSASATVLPTSQPVAFATVQTLLKHYCSECHTFPVNYGAITDLGLKIRQRIFVDRSMPRAGSDQAKAITDEERALVARWVDEGMKP